MYIQQKEKKNSPLIRIENSTTRHPLQPIENTICPRKRFSNSSKDARQLPTITSNIPLPKNGHQCTPKEAISLLSHFPNGSTMRTNLITKLCNEKKIPINMAGVYKLLKRNREGKVVRNNWNEV